MDHLTDFGGLLSAVRWFTASLVLIANRFPSVVQFSWRQKKEGTRIVFPTELIIFAKLFYLGTDNEQS
ncbi:hypothetical protein [Prevotella corporis]|uniref:hypothetical protein n=1 Tax=Prevotella corporis TaxID=28128 RepID=UPI0023F39FA6|nr:hypothetical protein [Prevotella corporis]